MIKFFTQTDQEGFDYVHMAGREEFVPLDDLGCWPDLIYMAKAEKLLVIIYDEGRLTLIKFSSKKEYSNYLKYLQQQQAKLDADVASFSI